LGWVASRSICGGASDAGVRLLSNRATAARTALAVYAALLFAVTLGPFPSVRVVRSAIPFADKLVHVGLFAGLGLLLHWNSAVSRLRWAVAVSIVPAVAVAGLIELIQGTLPYRSAELWDFIAGAIGAAVGVAAGALALRSGWVSVE